MSPISLWDEDVQFNQLMKLIVHHTIVDKLRCFVLYQFAKHVASLPGSLAEVGVYKGGTAKLIAKTAGSKTIYLFDTFSGMPDTDPAKDIHRKGDFNNTSLESVQNYLQDCDNVVFYPGLFPLTAKPVEKEEFCLVHLDVDIYQSYIDCCEFFYPKLVKAGIMVFDDYGATSCPGAKLAVDEFFSDKPESPCYLPTGQCFIIRH